MKAIKKAAASSRTGKLAAMTGYAKGGKVQFNVILSSGGKQQPAAGKAPGLTPSRGEEAPALGLSGLSGYSDGGTTYGSGPYGAGSGAGRLQKARANGK